MQSDGDGARSFSTGPCGRGSARRCARGSGRGSILCLVVTLLLVVPTYPAHAQHILLPIGADAFVASSHPTRNFESDKDYLALGFLGRYSRTILLGNFDLSVVAGSGAGGGAGNTSGPAGQADDHAWAGSPIDRAWLYLYNSFVGTSARVTVSVKRITAPWDEETVTYGSLPETAAGEIARFVVNDSEFQIESPPEAGVSGGGRGQWYRIDITPYVQQAMAGEPAYGLALVPVGERGVEFEFASNKAEMPLRPFIALEGSSLAARDVRTQSQDAAPPGDAGVDADAGTEVPPSDSVMVSLPALEDTWVDELRSNRNYGDGLGWEENGLPGEPALFLGFGGRTRRAVLLQGFDLERIPEGVPILAAQLKLYMVYSGSVAPVEISVRTIQSSWRELTVTYETLPEFSDRPWATTTVNDAILYNDKQEGKGRWVSWDVTELVKRIRDNSISTEGLLLYPEGDHGVDRQFDCLESREEFHPRLEVYLPAEAAAAAGVTPSPPAPEQKEPLPPRQASYPPDYSVSQADIDRLYRAVEAISDTNPYVRGYRHPESGTEHSYVSLEPTDADWAQLDRAVSMLQARDPEGLWVMTRIGTFRPEILITFLRSCDNVADRLETVVHELTHAGSGTMSPFMRPEYFTGKARQQGYGRVRGYSFLMDNECVGLAVPSVFFPRSTVLQYLPACERGGMAAAYLSGPSGTQDLMTLLDEVNAYTRGMRNNLALLDMQTPGKDIAFRLKRVLLFVELYLRHARTAEPAQYRQIRECRQLCAVMAKLAFNAREVMAQAEYAGVPVRDELYVRVFETEYREFERLFGTGGTDVQDTTGTGAAAAPRRTTPAGEPRTTQAGVTDLQEAAQRPFSHLPPTNRLRRGFILAY